MPSFLSSVVLAGGGAFIKRTATIWGLKFAAGLVVLIALQFALLAAFFGLWPLLGPIYAALAVCAGLLIVALALWLTAKIYVARAKHRLEDTAAAATPLAAAAAIAPSLLSLSRRVPGLVALGLVVGGMALARHKPSK